MALYPSLEDMKVDQMMKAQQPPASAPQSQGWVAPPPPVSAPLATSYPSQAPVPAPLAASYPGLAEYMGLELSEALIRENMPEYLPGNQVSNIIIPKARAITIETLLHYTTIHVEMFDLPIHFDIFLKTSWPGILSAAACHNSLSAKPGPLPRDPSEIRAQYSAQIGKVE